MAACILDADSPSYPPTLEEMEQCGCEDCRRRLGKEKPSGNEVVANVSSQVPRGESYYFKPGAPLPEHIPDGDARWQRGSEDLEISPCRERDKQDHEWEIMLRCRGCGFLIRCEHSPHNVNLLRLLVRAAYERIRHWLDSDSSAPHS